MISTKQITSTIASHEDLVSDNVLRPKSFEGYIGQDKVKEWLSFAMNIYKNMLMKSEVN